MDPVGSGQKVFEISRVGPGRVGSGSFQTSRIESGHPDPIRPSRKYPTREKKPWVILHQVGPCTGLAICTTSGKKAARKLCNSFPPPGGLPYSCRTGLQKASCRSLVVNCNLARRPRQPDPQTVTPTLRRAGGRQGRSRRNVFLWRFKKKKMGGRKGRLDQSDNKHPAGRFLPRRPAFRSSLRVQAVVGVIST